MTKLYGLIPLTLALLATSSVVSSLPTVESGLVDALAESIRQSDDASHEGVQLLYNVFLQITEYQCSRGEKDCDAWHAVNMIEALELSKTNCDEEKTNEMCVKARQFLEADGKLVDSDKELKAALVSAAEGISSEDYQYLNAIRDDVIQLICHRQPAECKHIREFARLENRLEDVIREKQLGKREDCNDN